jgi:hypothetical protein
MHLWQQRVALWHPFQEVASSNVIVMLRKPFGAANVLIHWPAVLCHPVGVFWLWGRHQRLHVAVAMVKVEAIVGHICLSLIVQRLATPHSSEVTRMEFNLLHGSPEVQSSFPLVKRRLTILNSRSAFGPGHKAKGWQQLRVPMESWM